MTERPNGFIECGKENGKPKILFYFILFYSITFAERAKAFIDCRNLELVL